MIYAPVLITTVNRYQHFRECIESLSRCTWAEKTDVYVAVDYPGKEEHWEGYRKIKDYLKHCGDLGFHSLNITYREENYFYSGKGNRGTLLKEVLKKHDRYICSEDDNLFSPNFLVYINKGLEQFKEDTSVLAIVGYRHFYPVKFDENNFYRQNVDFSAWGYGTWKSRRDKIVEFRENYGFYYNFSFSSLRKVYKNGKNRLCFFLRYAKRKSKTKMNDNALSVYMCINDMNIIMPKVSLVRNAGWDGSGEHCDTKDKELIEAHNNQELSNESDFIFEGTGYEKYEENRGVYVQSSYGKQSWWAVLKSLVSFFVNRILHHNSSN